MRQAGILMPISSLPTKYGIGTVGKTAYKFAEFLKKTEQSYWQVLPVGPTSYGDSPYQSFSAFAGNPYFIDLEMLISQKLLTAKDLAQYDFGKDETKVDYEALYNCREKILRKAFIKGKNNPEIAEFYEKNKGWLFDYSLFMALKKHFNQKSFTEWDLDIRLRDSGAIERYSELLKEDIEFNIFVQYLFFSQWKEFKDYANSLGVKIIGDIPIYVAMDSADTWANSDCFLLDENKHPIEVAGVPPDYFSKDGQLWGNPLYDWEYIKTTGYKWWIDRIGAAGELYDVVRIDHFRGFDSFFAVPADAKTAKDGVWRKGPGMDLIGVLNNWFKDISIIAEDLGILTESVKQLLEDSGYPGMKVLQFAFDSEGQSEHMPHNFRRNCVVYTGTHDNNTTKAWFSEAPKQTVDRAVRYFGLNEKEGLTNGVIRGALSSHAELAIIPMQDYLDLDGTARMNKPSTIGGNWMWRMTDKQLTPTLAKRIKMLTEMYARKQENDEG